MTVLLEYWNGVEFTYPTLACELAHRRTGDVAGHKSLDPEGFVWQILNVITVAGHTINEPNINLCVTPLMRYLATFRGINSTTADSEHVTKLFSSPDTCGNFLSCYSNQLILQEVILLV